MKTSFLRISIVGIAIVVATAFPRIALAAISSRNCTSWKGDVDLGQLTWNIALTRTAPGVFLVDVPSMWRAGKVVHGTNKGNRIILDLPYDLGKLSGTIVRCTLIGKIVRSDGRIGTIAWKPKTIIARRKTEIQFDVNGVHIAATLVRPAIDKPVPLVVVLHGGGDSSRSDSAPYTFWGAELSDLDYAVLLYDKRGDGGSNGDWRKVGFEERAADVVGMIDVLSKRPDIDARRIGLFAVSQGSWVAVRAAQLSEKISFIASIGGPVVPPRDADAFASWQASRNAGLSVEEADERLVLWKSYVDYIRGGTTDEQWAVLKRLVNDSRNYPWFARRPFDPTERHDWFVDWYARVVDFDPIPALRSLRIPILWLYGARDTQSDVARNVYLLGQLRDRENKPYRIGVFAEADHGVLLTGESFRGTDHYFTAAPGFLATIEDWLTNHKVF